MSQSFTRTGKDPAELNDFGLGRLVLLKTRIPIEYQPIEVSQYRLGVIAPQGLVTGSVLILETPSQTLYLQVSAHQDFERFDEYRRYELVALNEDVDLEALFSRHARATNVNANPIAEPIRFARFHTEPQMVVNAKTFGTVGFYQLLSHNVSRTGMLLGASKERQVPFLENTLLEVTLIPRGDWLYQPVICLAKVIRVMDHLDHRQNPERHFGIKFIEFDSNGQTIWDKTIRTVEQVINYRRDREFVAPTA